MFRLAITRSVVANARPLHSTAVVQKTVTEKVSEVADNVNKGVGKKLADAIGAGQEAAAKTKETLGTATEETKKKAGETAATAEQKKNEAASATRDAMKKVKPESGEQQFSPLSCAPPPP
uniref:Uncharacterized protein n=1 Tax=Mycena chlorophos TaxID=658473 RepID=A0ABQ0KXV4_MYCCL|nr:predicted protein [Mycena chlorophos]